MEAMNEMSSAMYSCIVLLSIFFFILHFLLGKCHAGELIDEKLIRYGNGLALPDNMPLSAFGALELIPFCQFSVNVTLNF